MKKSLFSLILCGLGLAQVSSSVAQCVVGGTDFDVTGTNLCAPILKSNGKSGGGGWYDDKLDWDKLCKGDMFIGPNAVDHKGLLSNTAATSGSLDLSDSKDIEKIFLSTNATQDASGVQYGKSTVTAQPKLINPFLKANETANNMFVNVGGKDRFPLLSYSMAGLEPGSTVTLECDVYDLFDITYFRYLNDTVCKGNGAGVQKMSDFMAGYNYVASTKEIGGGNKLEFAISSSADVKAGTTLFDPYNQNMLQRNNLSKEATSGVIPHGGSKHMTFSTKVPETGSLTFYFYKTSDCYKIPIGIDNIEIVGSIKPAITYTGNPCPEMPLRVFTKQTYPTGTKFSWKETVTGQSSTDANFIFVPKAPDTDYTVTCEVTLPGCTPSKSEPLKIHSGVCCTSTDGAPMAMTNLFFDDFGNFVSDDTYEWTDRYGVTHTEKIPAGHTHYAQSITSTTSIPCVRAYNIESTGATLKVPYLKDEGINKQLYDHGMYVVSAHGGYPSGVLNDNSGTTTGGMLQFDLDDGGSQDDFFEIDVEHICTGKEITFGADFASISEHPGCIEVQLLYGTKVLANASRSFTGGSDGWKGVNDKFTIESSDVGGASEVTVKMKVRHDPTCVPVSPRGETRDYGIDNIIFSVCTPPDVNVESSVSTGKDILDLCTEDVLTLTSTSENSEALERFYLYSHGAIDPTKKIGYVYQYTFDDPSTESPTKKITWKTLHKNAEVLTEKKFDVDVNTYWDDIFSNLEDDPDHEKRIYFRVVVGEYSDLIADQSWKTTSAFSSCRKISISTIPIVAGLNCAACTKPDPVKFSADGGKFNATKKTVELCAGQSVVLGMDNAVHGIDKNGDDYSNYDVAWFKDDVATPVAGGSKKCVTGTDDAAPTITVDYADVEAAGATGVKYIISLHDYFDGTAPTSCDIKDTIIVIGNPKPIETLTDPDPFCEGTLAAEPTKTITGYDIQWFESDADTAKASEITAPVVGDVTKTESPKSYWYVLTDATTGCRGDANEYVITVNKADANPVSGKIEYMKTEAVGGVLKPLDQQSTVLNTALAMTEYDLYVGLVSGATTQTAPELATSTLAAASTTVPSPAMVDPTSPDDEYLWYYTYLKSKVGGCLSDTVLVGVTIKGAPSPTTKDAAYCVNSANVAEMSTYAELALGTTGTLNFYDTDKTTLMAATDKPDVTTPGKYTYWASQTGAGGESSKQPIVIDVYGVNDVTLSESSHDYCLNDPSAVAVEAIASVATSTNDHIVNTAWEFFAEAANEPALNQPALGAATSMPVSTNVAGVYKYYARLKYDVSTALPTSTEVCYGKHEEYTVTVQSVEPPTGTGSITYLKSDGPTFNMPLVQDASSVVPDAGCTLQWYDEAMSPITEAQAKPVYNSALVGNEVKTYYVTQKNALGCESTPKTVTIMVSGYPTPSVTNLNVCENSPALAGTLQATANGVLGGDPASAFELVWYNSKADGTIDYANPLPSIALSPTIQTAATDGSRTKEYNYFVLQQIIGHPEKASAPMPVTVTINTNPKLTALVTAPKCKGESQDLSEMYNVSIENCEAQYSVGGTLTPSPKVVTEAGVYLVRGSYVINRGSALEETCASEQEELNVVFHELDVDIVGSDRTCPNVDVTLDADLHLGGGLTASEVIYSWTSDKNPTPASTKTYNTGTTGLQNARDVVRVSLEVSSAACTGTRAVKKTHVVTVGDGPLVGNIAFSETNNTEVKSYPVSSNGMMFNSCGGSVKVELSGIVNKDGGSYSLTGSEVSSGTFSSEASGDATLNLGAGTYMISYVNECPTKFEFEIVDKSAKSTQKNDELTICEGQTWSAEIINLVGPSNTTIEWQHDGTPISGETSTKLEFKPAKPSDSGVYTYSLFSAGCRFDGKIAMGSELTVKPYAKFDLASFQNHYEIVNGDALNQPIGFLVPTTVSEIENDVKYTGAPIPNGTTLDIPSVDKDYRIHITAENDLYCKAETDVEVLVDARLVMIAELDTSTMCEGESHKLIVDTTGTGKVLHKDQLVLKATETVGTNAPTVLTLKPQGGKLVADISPRKDATYDVTYTYSVGSQDASLSTPLTMRVYEAMDVTFSTPQAVCGDGESTTSVVVTPSTSVEDLDWSDNTPGEVSGNMTGADFTPMYTASGIAPQFKRYKVIAKNSVCQPTPFYTTVEVHKPLEGKIVASPKICQFDPLTLDASSYLADTYEWVYEEKDSIMMGSNPTLVPEPDFANFSLEVTRGKCKAEEYVTVEVTFAPVVMQVDSITYKTIEIQLDGDGSTGPYSYIIDGDETDPNIEDPLRSDVAYGNHTLKVVDQVGCFTETSFVVNSPSIKIPIIVSPDDNGVNDKFVVEGLAAGYPEAKVTIFDRWGKQLASYKAGDGTDWDGVYNGSKMPSTDYWYEIQIKEIQKTYTGHFTLIRQ